MRINTCGHPDRAHYAKDKCQSCYQSSRHKIANAPADLESRIAALENAIETVESEAASTVAKYRAAIEQLRARVVDAPYDTHAVIEAHNAERAKQGLQPVPLPAVPYGHAISINAYRATKGIPPIPEEYILRRG